MKTLSDAAREAQRAYKKNWRERNPERVAAAQARFWEKKGRELQQEREEKENANEND